MPRQSLYTQELADELIRRLSEGEPLRAICRDDHMPANQTVSDWRKAHPDFDARFLQARDDGFDAIALDALRISDTPQLGIVEKLEWVAINNPDDPEAPPVRELQVTERRQEDMLGHRKLQIETRLKLLAKWDPRRYGEKLDLKHSGNIGFSLRVRRRNEADE